MARPSVTGLVPVKNGMPLLAACLQSLSFCDELVVVDSGSTDGSVEEARSRGARVEVHPWQDWASQLAFAHSLVRTDWVIQLDHDERLSPELAASMRAALEEADPSGPAGYRCARKSFYLDRFLTHCSYPDLVMRLFRPESVRVRTFGPHYGLAVPGPAPVLAGDIIHYPYQDLAHHVDKINRYTGLMALEAHAKGKRSSLGLALAHGLGRFLKLYVAKRGFLDGRAGLLWSVHGAFYTFEKYARLVELEVKKKSL